ncbi:MAG: peptidylprolyl isomerase [Ignavibacteriaceae bacterium]|nr:peptidylprolyl isomerase [Ignavibacteriaceae bacterium]
MKFRSFILIFLLTSFTIKPTQIADSVVAMVGSYPVTLSEFKSRYTDYLIASGLEDKYQIREAILSNMINELLLQYFDSNEDIFNNEEYLKEVQWSEKQTVLAYLKDQEVYAKLTASEDEMRQTFVKVNQKIAARHLYAATEEEANGLYKLLQMGVGFEAIAKEIFTDSTLKNNGGYLGYFTWGDMDPAFEEQAYSMNVGEISKPVKTAFGYSIIKVEDRVTLPILTEYEFQMKKPKLERIIKIRKMRAGEVEYLNSVFDRSKFILNADAVQKLFADLNELNIEEISSPSSKDDICAEYNGEAYTGSHVLEKINLIPEYHRSKITSVNALKAVIEGLIIQQQLLLIAQSKGYDRLPVVISTAEKMKKNLFLKYKLESILRKKIVSDSVLFDYYTKNIQFFQTMREINLQEIIVESKEFAENIKARILAGEDFGELAKQFSIREWSAKNNGVLGFTQAEKFGDYEELFWNLDAGEVTGPLKIENGFGIFRMLGKIDSKPIDYSLVKDRVENLYKFDHRSAIRDEYLKELMPKARININYQLLSSFNIFG